MRRLFPLALLLVACGPTGGSDNTISDRGAAGPAASDPQTSKREVATTGSASTAPTPVLEGNPSRTHQLKDLKKVDVQIKGHAVHLWVMDDALKQEEGMMFLTDGEVKADEGMLFAFDSVQNPFFEDGKPKGFWMHNTLIPLDIVYMSPENKVLNVANGKIQDDTTLPARGNYKNVIELKAGTAARFGLKPGDAISIPKR